MAAPNPTSQRIGVRTKLAAKGWRETENRIKKKGGGGNDGWEEGEMGVLQVTLKVSDGWEEGEMGVLQVTLKVSESWGPGAAIVRCQFGLCVSNVEKDEAVVFDPI